MDIIKDISLSSAEQIYDKVSPQTHNFSFSDTIGSFIINNEFSHGYNQFKSQKENQQSYIWQVLSAVGQDFGDIMVQNVEHYIDNISNVDTCKVQALKNMMSLIDMDYRLLENTYYYPIEIVKLIDVLSINKRYLLDNKYIKQDFLNSLSVDGIITDTYSIGHTQNYLYSEEEFDRYIGGIFYNFIYDILDDTIINDDGNNIIVRNSLSSGNRYGKNKTYEVYDNIEIKRKKYGIESGFDYVKIADEINDGNDSIDNYQGYKREIIEDVIKERSEAYLDSKKYYKNSRYFYYRQKKVIEFAEFVDNTYTHLSSILNNSVYDYDKNYMLMQDIRNYKYVLDIQNDGNVEIDTDMVENVSKILVHIVSYIRKLRERTKTHTRQVFMKGTNNLLKYTVGQFLLDYFQQMKNNIENGENYLSEEEKKKFNEIYNNVQNIGREYGFEDSIHIQEYFDQTEYMNLSTETSYLGINGNKVNQRFFNEYFQEENDNLFVKDPKHFTTEKINDFYLNKLSLNNHFVGDISSNYTQEQIYQKFYRFLEVLFDIGANTSYYDKTLSVFGSKLSDGEYSTLRYEDFKEITKIRNELCGLKTYTSDYEFDKEMNLQDQEKNFLERYELSLSAEYLSAVSVMYDAYHPLVKDLSSQTVQHRQKLEDYLSGKYFYYFSKSNNEYCLDENGNYNLDYFLNNDEYPYDVYLYDRYKDAYDWITAKNHCRNWPVLCASTTLKKEYNSLKQDMQENILTPLSEYGYKTPTTENLGTILENCDEFIKVKIQNRLSYLTNALGNMRNQAQELKTQHDNIANTVDQIIAQNPGLEQGYAFKYAGYTLDAHDQVVPAGTHNISTQKGFNKYKDEEPESAEYDKFSGEFFLIGKKDNNGERTPGLYDQIGFSVSLDGNLEDRISELIGIFSDIYYGDHGSYNSGTNEALKSASTNLESIQSSIDSLITQINDVFQKFDSDITDIKSDGSSSLIILDRINVLIEYLGTKISEQDFEKDLKMVEYRGYEDTIRIYTERYEPLKSKYDNLFTVFGEYLGDFQMNNPSYTVYSATNLQKIYDYTIKQDDANLEIIKKWFQEFEKDYDEILEQFNAFKITLNNEEIYFINSKKQEYIYDFTSQIIEECIFDLENALLEDVTTRILIGNLKIIEKITYCQYQIFGRIVEIYYKHLKDRIGTYDEVTGRTEFEDDFMALNDRIWDDVVIELNEYLDYTNDPNYIQSKKIFKSYSGLIKVYDANEGKEINVATDPYYNHKNITHPSYQIHPFLWNFIEKTQSDSITDQIVKYITQIDIEDLEYPLVQIKIDEYLGEFGNIIEKWNKNINDYSGWTTRYEYGEHICQYTGLSSEVVDYDGAFYPSAIEEYRNGLSTVELLDKYYKHLRYEDDTTKTEITNKNLKDNYNAIIDITNNHNLSDVYDIFKYQTDAFGNMYILYKKYSKENPGWDEKLNTVGELWIRFADNPIAFPAKYMLDSESYEKFFCGEDEYFGIKDINITGDKTRIVIVFYQDKEKTIEKCINLFIQYDAEKCGIGTLKITTYNIEDYTKQPTIEYPLNVQISGIASYIGQYNYQNNINRTDVVFIERDKNDRLIKDSPRLFIYKYETNKCNPELKTIYLDNVKDIYTVSQQKNPPMTYWCNYNGDNYIDIAFITLENDYKATTFKGISVDMNANTEGRQYDDFTSEEMNSHDRLNQNVTIQRIDVNRYTQNSIDTNINTDIGYIPWFPGCLSTQCLDMSKEFGENYQSMELLGKSKNIDSIIDGVNKNVNPYLTKEDIISSQIYGRVYEDFDISCDRTLNIYGNVPLFKNMYSDDYNGYNQNGGYFYWTLRFDQYRDTDISSLKMIMYKVGSTGRNPYVVEDLSNILKIEDEEQPGHKTMISTYYGLEKKFNHNEYHFKYGKDDIKVVGTCNGIDEINHFFNNSIENISYIEYESYLRNQTPVIKIFLREKYTNLDTVIDKDEIRVAIINGHDFRQFEAYHFLDSNGFIKGKANDSYYVADNGKKVYLSSIHMSSYNNSEDIYAFATSKRLQFKYSDEDVFEQNDMNYYFPCLNVKIPYTSGRFFDSHFSKNSDEIMENDTVQIYDQDNIYRVIAQEQNVVSGLNGVSFEGDEYVDELRVYEEYLSTYIGEDGNIYNIQDRYSENDPQMYQYVHLYSDSFGSTSDVQGKEVPLSACSSVTIDYENGSDAFTNWMIEKNLMCLKGEQSTDDGFTSINFNFQDMTKEEKDKFTKGLSGFMNLYFSYKRTTEGIDLYVNYQNYINTPFIKIEGDKIYQDKIEGTYAIVKQDQINNINIVVQMCVYQGSKIYSVKNITVATYRIHNISDDKPKFIITKIKDLDDSNFQTDRNSYGVIKAEQKVVPVTDNNINFDYNVQLITNFDVKGTVSCLMTYDASTLSVLTKDNKTYKESDGCLRLYYTQYDKKRTIGFCVKQPITSRIYKLLKKPRPVVIRNIKSSENQQISSLNGYIRIQNYQSLPLESAKVYPEIVISSGTGNICDYYAHPTVYDVMDIIGNTVPEYGFGVTYLNDRGRIEISDNVDIEDIIKSADKDIEVIVTGKNKYSGEIKINVPVQYIKYSPYTVLGYSDEGKVVTDDFCAISCNR